MHYVPAVTLLLQLVAIGLAIRAAVLSRSPGGWATLALAFALSAVPTVAALRPLVHVAIPAPWPLAAGVAAAVLAVAAVFVIGSGVARARRSIEDAEALLATCAAAEAASPAAMFSIDVERRISTVNRAFCDLVGWPESELIGRTPPYPFWPPDRVQAASDVLHGAIQTRGRRAQEAELLRRDGTRLQVVLQSAPIPNGNGATVGWRFAATDVSEQVRQQAAVPSGVGGRVVVGDAAALLLRADDADLVVPQIVERLGRAMNASRAFLLEAGARAGATVAEWRAPGISPRMPASPEEAAVLAEELRSEVTEGGEAHGNAGDLPVAWRPALEAHGVRSAAVVAVSLGEAGLGFLGVDECKSERAWTSDEITSLRAVGALLAEAAGRSARLSTLERQSSRYYGLFEASGTPSMIIDPRSAALVSANPAACELYGLEAESLPGTSLSALYAEPEEAAIDLDGEARVVPMRAMRRADGATFAAQVRFAYYTEGEDSFCAVTVRDLTGRVKLERLVEDGRRRLARVIQTLPVGVCILRGEEQRLANDAVWRMFGFAEPPHPGTVRVLDQIASADRDAVRALVSRAISGDEGATSCEAWAVRQDGSTFPVRVEVAPILLPDGPAALAYLMDVTESVGAAHALRRRLSMEELVSAVSSRLINVKLDAMTAEINRSLHSVGTFLSVDHAFLCLLTDDRASVGTIFEWKNDRARGAVNVASLSVEKYPWVWSKLASSETILVPRVSALPVEAAAERARWEEQGLRSILLLPLMANGALVGVLGFGAVAAEQSWPQEDVRLLALVGQSLLTAFARMNVEGALREDLASLTALVNATPDTIAMVDREGRVITTNEALPRSLARRAEELVGRDIFELMPAQVRDARRQRLTGVVGSASSAWWQDQSPGKQWLNSMYPIVDSAGAVERVVIYCTDVTEQLAGDDATALTTMQLRTSLENVERRSEDTSVLSQAGATLQACLTTEELHEVIGRYAPRLFTGSSGALYMLNTSRTLAEAVSAWGEAPMVQTFTPESCWSLRRGRVHIVGTGSSDIPCRHIVGTASLTHMCVPLMALGEAIGVLVVQYSGATARPEHRSLEYEASIAMTFGERAALAVSGINLRRSLRDQAIRDPLTGLFNRRYMEETLDREMRRAAREGVPLSICMIDIDRFKIFNDVHGHDAGDAALMELGTILLSSIRVEDIPCRYGGEEFTLVLPGAKLLDAYTRVEEVRQQIGAHQYVHLGQRLASISISAGVACYPEHGETWHEVLRAADQALYRAKREGRDRTCTADLNDRAVSRPRAAGRRPERPTR